MQDDSLPEGTSASSGSQKVYNSIFTASFYALSFILLFLSIISYYPLDQLYLKYDRSYINKQVNSHTTKFFNQKNKVGMKFCPEFEYHER